MIFIFLPCIFLRSNCCYIFWLKLDGANKSKNSYSTHHTHLQTLIIHHQHPQMSHCSSSTTAHVTLHIHNNHSYKRHIIQHLPETPKHVVKDSCYLMSIKFSKVNSLIGVVSLLLVTRISSLFLPKLFALLDRVTRI